MAEYTLPMITQAGAGIDLTCCCGDDEGIDRMPIGTIQTVAIYNRRPQTETYVDITPNQYTPDSADYSVEEFSTLVTFMLDSLDTIQYDAYPFPSSIVDYKVIADEGWPNFKKKAPTAAERVPYYGTVTMRTWSSSVCITSWLFWTIPCYPPYQGY